MHNQEMGASRESFIRMFIVSIKSRSNIFLFFLPLYCSTVFAASNTQSAFTLAEGFFSDSLYMSAIENYRAYITTQRPLYKLNPQSAPTAFFKIGLCYYRTGNFTAAAAAFEEYVRLFPGNEYFSDALLYCGKAYNATGDFKNASEQLYRAWIRGAASPDRQSRLFESARCAEKDGNEERAISIYDEFLKKYPSDEQAKEGALSLAALYVKQKKFAFAAEVLAGAEKKWTKEEIYFTRLLCAKAMLAKAQQKIEQAGRLFSAVLGRGEDFPEKERALSEYAAMLLEQGQYKTLLPVYKKMFDLQQKKSRSPAGEFLFTWARCAQNAGNFDLAENLLREALDAYPVSPENEKAAFGIAECQVAKKETAKALTTLQELLSDKYSAACRAKAARAMGDIYLNQGLYPNAIAAYRVYCSIPGSDAGDALQFKIAGIYQDKGLFAAAIKEYDRCRQNYPQSPLYYQAIINAGQCEEARSHFQSAMERYDDALSSDAPSVIVDKAKKLRENLRRFSVPRIDSAVAALTRMAQTEGDGRPAYERLMAAAGIFDDMLNDYPAALEAYDRIERSSPPLPDSTAARVAYCKATVREKMYRKAIADGDTGRASALKVRVVALYQDAARAARFPAVADDAQFRILMLGAPSIGDLERYCARFPASGHVNEVLMRVGEYYEGKAGEPDGKAGRKAVDAYTAIAKSGGGDYRARALLSLARTWYHMDKTDNAAASVNELLRRYPDSASTAEGSFLAGLIEKKRGNYTAAMDAFKGVIVSHPFGEFAQRARYALAATQFDAGGFADALREYETCDQIYPGGENAREVRFGIARCLVRTGKTDEAGRMLAELMKEKNPQAIMGGIYYELGQCSKSKGDVQSALENFQKALAMDSFPDKGAACESLGALYFENSLYSDAARAFARCLQYDHAESDSAGALIGNINALIMDGQEQAAEKTTAFFKKRFGGRHGGLADITYYEGLRSLIEKRYDAAIKKFKYVIESFGGSQRCDDAAFQIGVCYYYMGKQEKALEIFYDFIAQYPGSSFVAMAYFKIGMMLHERGDFSHAAEIFERVVSASGGDGKTRFRAAYNAAIDYQKNSMWLEAARMYRTIIDAFPEEVDAPSTYLKIGFCYIQASHFEDALKYFPKAATGAAPDEKPEILYWMAHCWARLGDHQKAITEYCKVPALYPNAGQWAITSEFEAARLYEHIGETKKALALYKKIVLADGEKGVFGKDAAAQCARLNLLVKEN